MRVIPYHLKVWILGEEKEDSPQSSESPHYTVATGKTLPPIPGPRENYLLSFDENDPDHPFMLSLWKKVATECVAFYNITVVGWASSSIAASLKSSSGIQEEFHVGTLTATLVLSLFLLGYVAGICVWGPMSEMLGRQPPMIIGMIGFCAFCFAAATAKDIQTLMICRFFMAAFGCSAMVVGPAIGADIFDVKQRGRATSLATLAMFGGPTLATAINGYVSYSLGWRWTMYITGIMGSLGLFLQVVVAHETYPQIHLKYRAVHIRNTTGNWAISAPIESMELDTMHLVNRTILKPIRLTAVEPILMLFNIYFAFVFSILYIFFTGIPIIFGEHYGYFFLSGNARGNAYLPSLALFVGCTLMVFFQFVFLDGFQAKLLRRSGLKVCPEIRLPVMMVGGVSLPIGIFLSCWSANYHVNWIVPIIGLAIVGFGMNGILQGCLAYIIDTYLPLAATGISSNTFLRSGMAAGFVLFADAMFHNEGIQWAGTIMGCLTSILALVPFIFYFWGKRIRGLSKFAAEVGIDQMDLMDEMITDPAMASNANFLDTTTDRK